MSANLFRLVSHSVPRFLLAGGSFLSFLAPLGLSGCAQQRALQRANLSKAQHNASLLEGMWFAVARPNFETAEGATRETLLFQKKPEAGRKWTLTYRGWSNPRGHWFEQSVDLTESETGHLVGSFFGLPASPLYIVSKDRSGRALLVATSNRRRFFLLSRDQLPDPAVVNSLLGEARANELPIEELLFLQQP